MNALVVLIPVSLLLVGTAVLLFLWAVRHDQFRNLETPEILPLLDDQDQLMVDAPSDPDVTGRQTPKEAQP